MADNPYAQYAPKNPYAVYGLPRQAPMQTPDQAVGQQLQNTKNAQDIANNPLNVANTQANINQSQASVANQKFNQNQGLRQEFENLPLTKNFGVITQKIGAALQAPDTPQGDLAILYAFATVQDPNSAVREGEQDMARNTASLVGQLQQKYNMVTDGARLPPGVRDGLLETMRQNYKAINGLYEQQRGHYADLAKRNGFDPNEIVGPSPTDAVRGAEAQYITSRGGVPKINGVPAGAASTAPREGDIGAQQDPRLTELSGPQKAAYDAFWGANPNPTPQQLQQFGSTIGLNITNAEDIIKAKKQGRGLSSDIQATPDISDVRGGNGTVDSIRSAAGGVLDTATLGTLPKVLALGETIAHPSTTFDQNLARQYTIQDYDTANNFVPRLGGQIAGGAVLPMGEVNGLGNLALKGAGYGAAYGAGSSRSLADVPQNALLGAAAGAAIPLALGGAGRGMSALKKPQSVDPLVDPVTGELNRPMVDSMTPAQRMAVMQDYGMKTITPGMAGGRTARVLEQGFNNLPGSAGTMEDVNAAASGELRRSMQGVAQQFGTSKTLNEGGSAIQQAALARNDRAETVIGRAYQAIPISDAAATSKANTVGTLQQLTGRFQSNAKLAEAMHDPQLSRYLDAFQSGDVSWKDMKDFRSLIGEKIGQMRFGENSSTSDLRALYAALSQDMRDTASAQGPGALRAFERANNLNRQNEELIQGALTRILGKDGMMKPEQAAAAIQAMTKGGKASGDLKTLAQIRSATIKSGAWDEIASTLIHLGGQPANSEGRAFQPQTFVQWYADMSEPARAMLFKPELRKSLDGFVAMNQQLGLIKGLNNVSNTAPVMFGGGTLLTAAAALMNPILGLKLGGTLAGNYALGKLWTNAGFVKLITGLGRASLSGNQNAVQSQVGRLSKFAATNPEFSEPVKAILRQIANDNAPALGSAASQNPGPENQTQAQ